MNEELKIIISAEIGKLKDELNKGQKEVEGFSKEGESNFKKFTEAAKKVGKAVAAGLKVAITAIVAAGTALVALSESTAEFRGNQAKLKTAFEQAGGSAEQAKGVYTELYRVLGDDGQATEAAQHLAKLSTNSETLSTMTGVLKGVYATFGDSLPLEGLTEAVNHTAKLGEVQGNLADALEWGGVNVDEFNERLAQCTSEQDRAYLIQEELIDLYWEAGEAYEKNAADILAANEAQAKLTEGLAALGAVVQPIVTIFKQGLANVLQELIPYFELVSAGLQDMISGVDGGADKLKEGLQGIIDTAIATINNLLPTLLSIGTDIIIALLEGISSALPTLISTLSSAVLSIVEKLGEIIPMVTGAILSSLPSLLQAIVDIVVSILGQLETLIPTIVTQIAEVVPLLIDTLIANIPVLLEAAISFLMAIVDAIGQIVPPLTEQAPVLIENLLGALLENLPTLIDGVIMLFMGIVEALDMIIPPLVASVPRITIAIVKALIAAIPELLVGAGKAFMAIVDSLDNVLITCSNAISAYIGVIAEFFEEIKAAIADKLNQAKDKAVEAFDNLKSGISQKVSAAKESISTTFDNIKSSITSKINAAKSSVLSVFDGIRTGITTKLNAAKTAVKTAIDNIKSFFNFSWSLPKIKMPKFTITGSFSLNPPSVPKFSVSWNKLGGVFDKPTLFSYGGSLQGIGEDGAEAVVPLERNTQWLDRLASMLNEKQGNAPIVMQVDGKTFAEISCASINQLTKQRGRLALNLV